MTLTASPPSPISSAFSNTRHGMAEEDNEILDWGNEDDVVSLGDEDERYTLEDIAAPPQNGTSGISVASTAVTPPRSSSPQSRSNEASSATPDRKPGSSTPQPTESSKATPTATSQTPLKLSVPPRLTHALPPRPVTTNIPYVPPSDPSIVEATAMASRPKKAENVVQNPKNGSRSDNTGPLPPHWELRAPRSDDGHHYHNTQSGLEQRNRPVSPFHLDSSMHHAVRVGSQHPQTCPLTARV
ncbi:hypothetical protein P691DRAFT_494504 [Macrolepiota fuliginosa MF-IS2]|uniref:Uncharacterized protein n=1 Tax=Macrolepiota fuliginosa MF-IS2 TaxID=1400762 RepID=A0A9P6C3L7_9AGAR|nr:hypothetical protein P691DRAFT_494504 [Macrolepiota fuliginosa MF-IS2]